MAEEQGISGFARRETTDTVDKVAVSNGRISGRPLASFSSRESNAIDRSGSQKQRTIDGISAMVGGISEKQRVKQANEDSYTAAIAVARGMTAAQYAASGASTASVEHFAAFKSYEDIQSLELQYRSKMDEYATLSPAQFDAQLKKDLSKIADNVPPRGQAEFAQQLLAVSGKLAADHEVGHTRVMVGKYKDTLSSTISTAASNKDAHTVNTLVDAAVKGTVAGLNSVDAQDVIVQSMAKALITGDKSIYDLVSSSPQYNSMVLSTEQQSTLSKAQEVYINKEQSKLNVEYTTEMSNLTTELQQPGPKGTVEDHLRKRIEIQKKYNMPLTNSYSASWAATFRDAEKTEATRLVREAKLKEAKLLSSPVGRALAVRVAEQENDIYTRQELGEQINIEEELAKKKALYDSLGPAYASLWNADAQRSIITFAQNAQQAYIKDTISEHNDAVKAEGVRKRSVVAYQSGDLTNADGSLMTPAEQQQAAYNSDMAIMADYGQQLEGLEGPEREAKYREMMGALNSAWAKSGIVNKKLKGELTATLSGDLVDDNGVRLPNVNQAAKRFYAMYQSNPQLAMQHVSGNDKALLFASTLIDSAGSTQDAIETMTEASRNGVKMSKEEAVQFASDVGPELDDAIADQADSIVESQILGIDHYGLMPGAEGKYGNMLKAESDLLQASSENARPEIAKIARQLKINNPAYKPEHIAKAAVRKYFSNRTAIGGNYVPHKKGLPSPKEQMGLQGANSPNVEHAAIIAAIREQGIQFPKKDQGFFDRFELPELDDTLLSLSPVLAVVAGHTESDMVALRGGIPPLQVRAHPDGTGVIVQPAWLTDPPMKEFTIMYRDAGNAYRKRRSE